MSVETTEPFEEKDEMSIWDHIGELRMRLVKAMGALVITTAVCAFGLANYALVFLAKPVGGLEKLVAIEVTESVGVYMRVALLAGFILAFPVIAYQLLAFIVPGLYDNERRYLFLAIPLATVLFLSGVAFSYYVMLPTALPFLLGFLPVNALPRVSTYINFVTSMLFWIGIAFETPLVVFLLAKFHIVTPRFLIQQWRFAVVIIAVLAALITPTVDPVSMGLLMAPLFAIYLLSILFATLA
jgi:sec-independent protein translocase protein TatC